MNIDDFNGFLKYKDEFFPFSFSKNEITIHPYSIEKKIELLNEWFHNNSIPKNKWLNKIIIDGVTDKNKGVKFFVTDNPSYFNGYYKFKIDYMYIYRINSETNEFYPIDGIRFKGPEINYFYNVSDYVKTDFEINSNNTFERFALELSNKKDKKFGKFRWHNYSVSVNGSFSWKKDNDIYGPLEINSLLVLEFSRPCTDLKKIIELIQIQKIVMYFTCYRKNINFIEIDTYAYCENKLRDKIGNFYILNDDLSNTGEERNILKRIITLNDTQDNYSKLYKLISSNKLYTTHICNNSYDRHLYTPSRILSIIIAFEHLFKTIYPDVKIQSKEFDAVKKDVIDYIDAKIPVSTGKLKKKYKNMKNSVDKLDISYGDCLKYALKDNFNVLREFIQKRYKVKNSRSVINGCSNRVNFIRNQMAHGKLDLKYKPINSNDIYIIELLLYSMVLKKIGLKDDIINLKIKCLFNIS